MTGKYKYISDLKNSKIVYSIFANNVFQDVDLKIK